MSIAIVGAGKWGEALQNALLKKNKVLITSRTKRDLPFFTTLDKVLDCEYILMVISAQSTKEWLDKNFKFKNQKILVASKGIDLNSKKFLDQIYEDYLPKENLSFLSGPSFASEVLKDLPTAVVISSISRENASKWLNFFPKNIKAYINNDVRGVEVGGAYKNVIAIAAGISDGLSLGNNARAALITRGLAEITRFGIFFGAQKDTFLGLSGVGDLFLTAGSNLSRNYRVGLQLANGVPIEKILNDLGEVAEGVPTTKAICEIAKEHKIYTPIADEILEIISGKNAKISLEKLLTRTKKEEF